MNENHVVLKLSDYEVLKNIKLTADESVKIAEEKIKIANENIHQIGKYFVLACIALSKCEHHNLLVSKHPFDIFLKENNLMIITSNYSFGNGSIIIDMTKDL